MRDKKKTVVSLAAALVLLLASVALILYLKASSEAPPEISQGKPETRTIQHPVSAGGTLQTEDGEKQEFVCGVVIKDYLVSNGTIVKKDDPIAAVDRDSVSEALNRLNASLKGFEYEERKDFYGNYTVNEAGVVTVGNQKLDNVSMDYYLRFLDDMELRQKTEDQITWLIRCQKAGALLATADGMIQDLSADTIEESVRSRNDDVTADDDLNKLTLCQILPVAVIKATVKLDERVVLDVQEGQTVTFDVPAVGKTGIPGTVSRISRVGSDGAAVGKYEVDIDIDNDGSLLPGMTVVARIIAQEKRGTAAIPLAALDNIGGKDVLYTALDAKTGLPCEPVAVELGISDDFYAELLGGLGENDTYYYYPRN